MSREVLAVSENKLKLEHTDETAKPSPPGPLIIRGDVVPQASTGALRASPGLGLGGDPKQSPEGVLQTDILGPAF